jgi:hypothetical protein
MATIWDANNKQTNITLSGGSLTATAGNTSSSAGVRATRVITGPTYLEYAIGSLTGGTLLLGLAAYSWAFASLQLGADNSSLSYQSSGVVRINGITLSTIQGFAATNTVQMFYSPRLEQVWFNVNNGNWNNSVSNVPSDNPATAVGGISTATLLTGGGGPLFPAMSSTGAAGNTNALTAHFSSSGWTYSAPTGGASVDACGGVGKAPIYASGTPDYVGAATQNPVTTTAQKSPFNIVTGGSYSQGANTPNLATKVWSPAATATHVSGTVTENGLPVAKIVRIYDHNTGDFLGETTSSAVDGTYSIPALGRTNVVALAFDLPNFDAIVWDEVTPV